MKKGCDMSLPALSLILGGAASGKSRFAEALAAGPTGQRTSFGERIYVATAQAQDAEMRAKIERHRTGRGPDWRTIEAPLDVAGSLGSAAPSDIVLIDCATLWLSNQMLAGADIDAETLRLLAALTACAAPVVIVTNEVGQSIVPENPLARRFRNEQGRLNQRLAAQAGLAVLVVAGLPLVLKGALP